MLLSCKSRKAFVPSSFESLKHRCSIHYSCKFAVEIAQSRRVNIRRRTIAPVQSNPIESGSSIGNDIREEA